MDGHEIVPPCEYGVDYRFNDGAFIARGSKMPSEPPIREEAAGPVRMDKQNRTNASLRGERGFNVALRGF